MGNKLFPLQRFCRLSSSFTFSVTCDNHIIITLKSSKLGISTPLRVRSLVRLSLQSFAGGRIVFYFVYVAILFEKCPNQITRCLSCTWSAFNWLHNILLSTNVLDWTGTRQRLNCKVKRKAFLYRQIVWLCTIENWLFWC